MRENVVREALVRLEWSQKTLAERLGVDPDTVSRWCLGRVPVPGYAAEYLRVILLAKGMTE